MMIRKSSILHVFSLTFFNAFMFEGDASLLVHGMRDVERKRLLQKCQWIQIGNLLEGDNKDDEMGWTISTSVGGKYVAVGVPAPDAYRLTNPSGLVRVFKLNKKNKYRQIGEDIVGENKKDNFGVSLDQSSNGKIVAVGAWYGDGKKLNSGHVRVFKLEKKKWVQLGEDLDGENKDDFFGNSVSLSGNGKRIVVSADDYDSYRGQVKVFELSENNKWVQLGSSIDGESEDDEFGASVAISANGKIIAVGAGYNTNSAGEYAGHVMIFKWASNKGDWIQVGQSIEGENEYNGAGTSVSLNKDGSIVAIGAPQNSPTVDQIQAGHVRVFRLVDDGGKRWIQLGEDIEGDSTGDNMGDSHSISLSLNGDRIAVGARGDSYEESKSFAGVVKVFDYDEENNKWDQIGQDIYGKRQYAQLGFSVSLSGDGETLSAGAAYGKNNKGYAQVLRLECS